MTIDALNYAPLAAPGLAGPEYRYEEFQIMIRTTFRRMATGGTITTQWGREIPLNGMVDEDPTLRIDEAIEFLDRTGIETTVLNALKMWSYQYHHKLIIDYPESVVAEAVAKAPDRFIGAAGYNPFRIEDSLRTIDSMVREHGFRYVYFHPGSFGLAPDDARCYPLYGKCIELSIPVGMQVGHSAEVLPSDVGRPYLVDRVAIDFPNLKINMSHTGWPWTAEFCSMIWRHPNVYGDIAAYFASGLDQELVAFMDSGKGRNKIMFGSNGMDPARAIREIEELPISDKTKERVLTRNAQEFFGF